MKEICELLKGRLLDSGSGIQLCDLTEGDISVLTGENWKLKVAPGAIFRRLIILESRSISKNESRLSSVHMP
jgi:hypothetical protein